MLREKIMEKLEVISQKIDSIYDRILLGNDEKMIKLMDIEDKIIRHEIRDNKSEIDKKYFESIDKCKEKNQLNNKTGKIRVGRIAGVLEKGRKYPISFGYTNIILSPTNKIRLGSSLANLKYNGMFIENIYQFSKLFQKVPKQKQKNGWSYGAETHSIDKNIMEGYWSWREKGMNFSKPIKHPAGYDSFKYTYFVWPYNNNYDEINNPNYPMKFIKEDEMKKIMAEIYYLAVKDNPDFIQIKRMINDGINIQLLLSDVNIEKNGVYGQDKVGSISFKEIERRLDDPETPFNSVYILVKLLND